MNKNTLSLTMLVALVTGNMIGSGVFLLPSSLASYGVVGLLAWCLTACGALILALIFSEYARFHVAVGGPYAYCRETFGDFIGFQTAFNWWLALWVGNAAISVAFVSYLSVFIPAILTSKLLSLMLSLLTVWTLTIVNLTGVGCAGVVQIITTFLKVTPLVIIGIFGIPFIDLHHFELGVTENAHLSFSLISSAAFLTLWSFIGVESATVPADNIENPTKNIPKATIFGVLLTMVAYLSSAFVVMGVMPASELAQSSAPYADTALKIFGKWGEWCVAIGALAASFGALNGCILLQGQVPYAAAKDGLFPQIFAKRNSALIPQAGLIISSGLISVLLCLRYTESLVDQFTFIIRLATFATLIPYLFSSIGLLMFFRNDLTLKRIFLGGTGFLFSIAAVIGSGQAIVYFGGIVFFAALPIYFWIKRNEKTV